MQNQAPIQNDYLQEVVQKKLEVEQQLRRKRSLMSGSAAPAGRAFADAGFASDDAPAVDTRVTGMLWWKSVVVPPNAYVVHTRRGHADPVTIGLGKSFRFNPRTDAYLAVPAALQTIVINARCICKERQGLLVQAYVQWTIDDFATAYRTLDFSDPVDPMGVVNVQLQEQAEATIKDTVATMSIDAVLDDKQPIIEELTRRLRALTEGGGDREGLGLRIVTVQIKEAVVSSTRLWKDLQRPFRAERAKTARLAELSTGAEVRQREDADARIEAEQRISRDAAIARRTAEEAAKAFDQEVQEAARRAQVEADLATQRAEQQRIIIEKEAEIERLKLQQALALEALRAEAQHAAALRDLVLEEKRQAIANRVSPDQTRARLVEALPQIAAALPRAEKQTTVAVGESDRLTSLIRGVMGAVDAPVSA
jgi:regulator of protease activity HflC (stomatin/prohibitin superfamily)